MIVEIVRGALALVIAPAAFLLPGWLISRAGHSPARLLTGFFVSCVLWFHLVLACDLLRVRLDRFSLLGGWLVICVIVLLVTRRLSADVPSPAPRWPLPSGRDWWWLVVATLGLGSVATRAVIDPLSGWDNSFRWDYLAHAVIEQGNLRFYPAMTARDFELYAWCDGIPPLVPLLNVWLYLVTGMTAPVITAVRVIGEAALIAFTVFRAGRGIWGDRGGWAALGLAGTSSLLLWSIAIGQETGLLTLSVIALLWFLERYRREPQPSTLIWAGIAAGVGALSRDYGLAFGALALALLVIASRSRRESWRFGLTFLLIVLPWYTRNAVFTGNPLFPQTLGGIFAGNAVFTEFQQAVKAYWQVGSTHVPFVYLGATLLVVTGVTWLAGAVGISRRWPAARPYLAAALLTLGLWLWSVAQTAGGLNYSMRVLAPVAAIGAVLGGWVGTLRSPWWRAAIVGLALLTSLDAARRAWLLPVTPFATPFSLRMESWRAIRNFLRESKDRPAWDYLVRHAEGRVIAVDSPELHASLTRRGGRATLFFSPALAPCFNDALTFEEIVRQLKAADVKFIVLLVADPVARTFMDSHAFLRALNRDYLPNLRVDELAVYDLDELTRASP